MALRDQPYIPLYVQDFLCDEQLRECSAESVGVYIMLMCVMHKSKHYGQILLKQNAWQNEKFANDFAIAKSMAKSEFCHKQISDFAIKIAKHLPFDVDTIVRALEELIAKEVLTMEENCLYQKRMVKDNELSETRAAAGKAGADAKWGKDFAKAKAMAKKEICHDICHSKTDGKTIANTEIEIETEDHISTYSDVVSNKDSTTTNQVVTDTLKKSSLQDERFAEFWKAYPKKQGKGAAETAWKKAKVTAELHGVILAALEKVKGSEQWRAENGRFIPNPATWLNQRRWEDEPQTEGGIANGEEEWRNFVPSTGFRRAQ